MANTFVDVITQANLIGTVFSSDVLQPFRPAYIFDDVCKEKEWNRGNMPTRGDTIVFTVKAAYSANTAALDPTATSIKPSAAKRSYTRQTIGLEIYGDHDTMDIKQLPVETFADDVLDVAKDLEDQGMNSRNLLARDAMDGLVGSATYNYYGSNGTASNIGPMIARDIRKAVASLRGDNIPVFANGYYVGIINENQYTQLRADSDNASWTDSTQYVDGTPLKSGVIPVFEGVAFIVNNQIRSSTSTAHAYVMGREFCGKATGYDLLIGTKSSLDGPHDNLMTVYWDMLLGYALLRRNACRIISTSNTAI